ncbi:calcium-binding protein, putative [Entamoeba invadens IP1]|uniref:Calcium-binding protein, putative n=1 Tax=Entamoeba invadens IP1 TaxID=370355 RepID=A0A0A1UBL6_ENTIV|nr:calcium-binding protein, putative [Entamoeba invadens IP1]ELP92604.1 calcium-binding protein, putative [Entamoeba invadens IP1]|eukprot:XP_004259375.1 calcium-binding protein, putative [Entamoeba invadens IP1]
MAEAAFKAIDTNNDGKLQYEEVKAAIAAKKEIKNEKLVQLIFKAVDVDNDGTIDLPEFTKFHQAIAGIDMADAKVGLKVLYKLMDADGDGKLTKDEVTAFFKKVGCEQAVEQVMKADANGDGYITMEEFCAFSL